MPTLHEEPPRTLGDPREQDAWFQRLPAGKQDEMRQAWARGEVRLANWRTRSRRSWKRWCLNSILLLLAAQLFVNVLAEGFSAFPKALLGSIVCGPLVGHALHRIEAGRFYAGFVGAAGYCLAQSVCWPFGSFGMVLGALLATYFFSAAGIVAESRASLE